MLCETVKNFVAKVGRYYSSEDNSDMPVKCRLLEEKLASLLDTLTVESKMAEMEQAVCNNSANIIKHVCEDFLIFCSQ